MKKRLDKVDADIVILGGDIVDESTTKSDMEYVFEVFGDIKNKKGIYYVYGNHDRQQYKAKPAYTNNELINTIIDNNIEILYDNYVIISDSVVLAGREDYSHTRETVTNILKDVNKDDYIIMVDHQPVQYVENIDNGVDLIVSGHTHGGQVFPIEFFINLLHTADLSYGYEKFENMDAIVSSGLVGWGYPIRTQKHSEYVIVDIKQKK